MNVYNLSSALRELLKEEHADIAAEIIMAVYTDILYRTAQPERQIAAIFILGIQFLIDRMMKELPDHSCTNDHKPSTN